MQQKGVLSLSPLWWGSRGSRGLKQLVALHHHSQMIAPAQLAFSLISPEPSQ